MGLHASITVAAAALGLLLFACGGEATSAPTSALQPAPTPEAAPAGSFRLTILYNNDGESQLVDLGGDLKGFGGVARFAAVVRRERQVAASYEGAGKSGLIMVSSGDNFVPGAELTAGLRAGVFYDALALDPIGYDAIALGNHEFDFGPEVLAEFIEQVSNSQAPFLNSNLDFSDEPCSRAWSMMGGSPVAWWWM
jgi:5'-nucleotidase